MYLTCLSIVGWDQSRRAGTPAHRMTRRLGGPALALLAGPTLRSLILSSRFNILHGVVRRGFFEVECDDSRCETELSARLGTGVAVFPETAENAPSEIL